MRLGRGPHATRETTSDGTTRYRPSGRHGKSASRWRRVETACPRRRRRIADASHRGQSGVARREVHRRAHCSGGAVRGARATGWARRTAGRLLRTTAAAVAAGRNATRRRRDGDRGGRRRETRRRPRLHRRRARVSDPLMSAGLRPERRDRHHARAECHEQPCHTPRSRDAVRRHARQMHAQTRVRRYRTGRRFPGGEREHPEHGGGAVLQWQETSATGVAVARTKESSVR